jgi:hypothetical protein
LQALSALHYFPFASAPWRWLVVFKHGPLSFNLAYHIAKETPAKVFNGMTLKSF